MRDVGVDRRGRAPAPSREGHVDGRRGQMRVHRAAAAVVAHPVGGTRADSVDGALHQVPSPSRCRRYHSSPIAALIVVRSSSMQAAQRPVLPDPGARPHGGHMLLAAALAALTGVVWGVSSPSSGVSHLDRGAPLVPRVVARDARAMSRGMPAPCRAGCPRHVARDARAIVSMGAHAAGSTTDTTRPLPSASSIVCNPPVTMPCSFCSNQVLLKAAGTTTHANSPTRPTPRYIA